MIPSNAVIAAQQFLLPVLAKARCVVDATAGNGNDTLFLCRQTAADCRVVTFDIQLAAIRSATVLIARHGYQEKIRWIHDDHAKLAEYIATPVDAAVFNLGYLPGQAHCLTTKPESLGLALASLLALLVPGGRITVVAYPGHAPGRAEIAYLEELLSQCPQPQYVATRLSFINQRNNPAILYTIGKARRNPHENSPTD